MLVHETHAYLQAAIQMNDDFLINAIHNRQVHAYKEADKTHAQAHLDGTKYLENIKEFFPKIYGFRNRIFI